MDVDIFMKDSEMALEKAKSKAKKSAEGGWKFNDPALEMLPKK